MTGLDMRLEHQDTSILLLTRAGMTNSDVVCIRRFDVVRGATHELGKTMTRHSPKDDRRAELSPEVMSATHHQQTKHLTHPICPPNITNTPNHPKTVVHTISPGNPLLHICTP